MDIITVSSAKEVSDVLGGDYNNCLTIIQLSDPSGADSVKVLKSLANEYWIEMYSDNISGYVPELIEQVIQSRENESNQVTVKFNGLMIETDMVNLCEMFNSTALNTGICVSTEEFIMNSDVKDKNANGPVNLKNMDMCAPGSIISFFDDSGSLCVEKMGFVMSSGSDPNGIYVMVKLTDGQHMSEQQYKIYVDKVTGIILQSEETNIPVNDANSAEQWHSSKNIVLSYNSDLDAFEFRQFIDGPFATRVEADYVIPSGDNLIVEKEGDKVLLKTASMNLVAVMTDEFDWLVSQDAIMPGFLY